MRSARLLALVTLAASSLIARPATAQAPDQPPPPEVGATAPDFTLPAATRYGVLDQPISLKDFAGKTVVLAFFPRARTPGCTIQMHAYRDQYAELFRSGQDVVLVAISMDSAEDLYSWARDDQFQFVMASDVGGAVAEKYGASRGRIANRFLFVIAPDGKVAHRQVPFQEVDPMSYEQLGEALDDVVVATQQ